MFVTPPAGGHVSVQCGPSVLLSCTALFGSAPMYVICMRVVRFSHVVYHSPLTCECKCDRKPAYYYTPSGIRTIGAAACYNGSSIVHTRICLEIQRVYHDVHLSQHDLLVLQGHRDECHLV